MIRHLTPEAIWQERFMTHANHAVALEALIMAVPDPAETAARVSRLAGVPVTPDPVGGFALQLDRGLVRMLDADGLAAALPGIVPPLLPFMAGIVVRTDDGAASVRGMAALEPVPGGWMARAGGAAVVFA